MQILMSRDGLSKDEAIKMVKDFFFKMEKDVLNGGDPLNGRTYPQKNLVWNQITLRTLYFALKNVLT